MHITMHAVIVVLALIAIVAVVWYFLQKASLPQPIMILIYFALAVFAIWIIYDLANGGPGVTIGYLSHAPATIG